MHAADVAALSPDQRRELLRELLEKHQGSTLSAGERWIWTLQQLAPTSSAYNFAAALRLRSRFDVGALQRALQAILERHETFRSVFAVQDGEPVRIARDGATLTLRVVSATDWSATQLRSQVNEEAERPFDLATGPVFRANLFRSSDHDAVLLLVWHHIAIDGWSLSLVLDELGTIYSADVSGSAPGLPSPAPYTEFVRWQAQLYASESGAQQRAHWREQLRHAEVLALAPGRARPLNGIRRGAAALFRVSTERTQQLAGVAALHDTTLFVVLLAAFEALLHRVTGQNGVLVSFPANGRTERRFEHTAGYFINQVAVGSDIQDRTTFRDLIAQTRTRVLAALENQDYHLSLISESGAGVDAARQFTADVMFVLQKSHTNRADLSIGDYEDEREDGGIAAPLGTLGPLVTEPFPVETHSARFDLELQMMIQASSLGGWLQYDRDLIDDRYAHDLTERFQLMLAAIALDADQLVSRIDLMLPEERATAAQASTAAPDRSWPDAGGIADMFERQARATPNAVAAVFDGAGVTFGELDSAANRIAQYLRHEGAAPRDVVGICVPRSIEMLAALVGIIKAGCTYLPLDPSHPRERLQYIVKDSGTPFLITSSETCGWFRRSPAHQLCLHCDAEVIQGCADVPPRRAHTSSLYVVYTSGSTGEPKGVVGTEASALNRFNWMWDRYPFQTSECCAQITTLGFVDAVWEIFGPLLQGVPIVIVPDEDVRDIPSLTQALEHHGVTRITLVPSLLRVILEWRAANAEVQSGKRLGQLRYWSCSGEALPPDLVMRFQSAFPRAVLLNLYGCSEAGADSCWYEFEPGWHGARVPIGSPISNTRILILDRYGNISLPGTVGEIHIGGAGLAAGYLDRPQLTNERFIADPFSSGERLYRTGDLGRSLPDGNIEYVGRSDHQVKIRGNRVEIGEVEAALQMHPGVSAAAVSVVTEQSRDNSLVAYVVARSESVTNAALRTYLASRLPGYMVPSQIVHLSDLPLTSTGKIDRRALPTPVRDPATQTYVTPQTDTERALCDVWAQVLGVPRIGVDDDFFECGGHSILAVTAASRASRVLNRQFPVGLIFSFPTVASCAARFDAVGDAQARHQLISIQPRGSLPPLFWIPGGAGSMRMGRLKELADRLGPDQPFHALGSRRAETRAEIEAVPERARAYVSLIRDFQPRGPYYLAGFCLGGVVSFEVAQQLRALGQTVAFLGLVNTWMPADSIPGSQWLQIFFQRALHHARVAMRPGNGAPHRYILRRVRAMQRTLRRNGVTSAGHIAVNDAGGHEKLSEDAVLQSTIRLARSYEPRQLEAKVYVFLSEEPDLTGVSERLDPRVAWRTACTEYESVRVSGGHDEMLDPPLVDEFAAKLQRALQAARGR